MCRFVWFSVIRSFIGLGRIKNVLVLDVGLRYALLETPREVDWFEWVWKVLPEKTLYRVERIGFGAWVMFHLGLELVKAGWEVTSVMYYNGEREEIKESSEEFLKRCLRDPNLFFNIRSITLEKSKRSWRIVIDGLTSLIGICGNPVICGNNEGRVLVKVLNKVLSRRDVSL